MLVYLVQHRDRVVPKEELLEQLWPQQYVSEAILSQRLMLVRKAVGDSGSQQRVIKTVHRRGYRFIATVEEQTEVSPGQSTPMAPLSTSLPPPAQERTDTTESLRGSPPCSAHSVSTRIRPGRNSVTPARPHCRCVVPPVAQRIPLVRDSAPSVLPPSLAPHQ